MDIPMTHRLSLPVIESLLNIIYLYLNYNINFILMVNDQWKIYKIIITMFSYKKLTYNIYNIVTISS